MPVVTILLIVANLAAAFGAVLTPDLVQNFGFDPQAPSVRGAITGLFLHLNVVHLLGNMVFLAAVGPAVETSAGSVRFLIVYFLGGLAGVGAHYLFAGSAVGSPPLIGASACVASCAAYYTIRYSRLRVPLGPGLAVPIVAVVGVWGLLQLIAAFVSVGGSGAATGYWAHVGGLAMGLLLGWVFKAPELAKLHFGYAVLEKMNERSVGATLAAADLHLKSHPDDPKALKERLDALSTIGDSEGVKATLLQLLEQAPEDDRPQIVSRLGEQGVLGELASLKRMMLADRYKAGHPAVARMLLLSVVEGDTQDGQRPDALLALAGLDADDPATSKQWIGELFERYPMHPACDLARARGWAP